MAKRDFDIGEKYAENNLRKIIITNKNQIQILCMIFRTSEKSHFNARKTYKSVGQRLAKGLS